MSTITILCGNIDCANEISFGQITCGELHCVEAWELALEWLEEKRAEYRA